MTRVAWVLFWAVMLPAGAVVGAGLGFLLYLSK